MAHYVLEYVLFDSLNGEPFPWFRSDSVKLLKGRYLNKLQGDNSQLF